METLDESNKKNAEVWRQRQQPRPNNIACPKCGKELYDIPGLMLTSDPPQLRTICKECGFDGGRVAP